MTRIVITSVALRIFGDDLIPEEITHALGAEPTRWAKRGEAEVSSPRKRLAKTGFWQLSMPDRQPGDLDAQINGLFTALTDDLSIWASLTERHGADLFCGLFMNETNEGVVLERETLQAIASRGLALNLDIYGPSVD